MATVKITFSVEIDGVNIVNHFVQRDVNKKQFELERRLSVEIIDRLNTLYTNTEVFNRPWQDLETLKKEKNLKNLPHNYFTDS
ncbi:hypothetical protein A6046_00900 [[Haemophilus] ducreyi]|uniref:Uncharacterized protein n=2 Tax=Haemophilus ducreyi TaxID=730 RepID=Q7VML2_HAEDU|nr:hypothetical protein [[Haemophilus] ducreyi]AAP95844.1 hypothetical protein HD_0963 [[Haemophilus] ducreyi 35000HP]AKO30871.1 hypothetical protein RY60_03810 [[Haemophilus] ducreyi]AKO32309.1 hypothetical protein RZ57_03815 [[Haemophilus] ducreyi]AKO33763.1 hypothetical protein RZ58_03830 [[Haemophilus] ducreyi]AKO35211.1 hypothetical protein RZ59_03795 [[Haemophilus] ducreyi]